MQRLEFKNRPSKTILNKIMNIRKIKFLKKCIQITTQVKEISNNGLKSLKTKIKPEKIMINSILRKKIKDYCFRNTRLIMIVKNKRMEKNKNNILLKILRNNNNKTIKILLDYFLLFIKSISTIFH